MAQILRRVSKVIIFHEAGPRRTRSAYLSCYHRSRAIVLRLPTEKSIRVSEPTRVTLSWA
jgi:hypothetical protein